MWAKWHDFACVLFSIGAKKCKLTTISWVHRDLMIPRTGVEADKIQSTMTLTKAVNGVVAP